MEGMEGTLGGIAEDSVRERDQRGVPRVPSSVAFFPTAAFPQGAGVR